MQGTEVSDRHRLLKALASTVGEAFYIAGGASASIGGLYWWASPPTQRAFQDRLELLCPPHDTAHLNLRDCPNNAFVSLGTAFPDNIYPPMILGAISLSGGVLIKFFCSYYSSHNRDATNQQVNRCKKFIRAMAPTGKNVLYGVGGVLLPNSLQALLNQSIPVLQQIENGICQNNTAAPLNLTVLQTTSLVCDVNKLTIVAAAFIQPDTTLLWTGGFLILAVVIIALGYNLFTSFCYRTGADNFDEDLALNNNPNQITA